MATARSDNRRKSSSNPSRSRNRSRKQASNGRKLLQGRDTGYRVGSSRRQNPQGNINPRLIVVGVVGLLLIIALVFGISTCVRGCANRGEKKDSKTETTTKVNPEDERVAFGVSSDETAKLSVVLDRNESFAAIAKAANKYNDERMIDLAINEPEAIEFVKGAIKTDHSTQPYSDSISQGEYPLLYTFDTRWGYSNYADGMMGVTGSGPVALSMASMGLSGKTTYDPATIAAAISAANLASGSSGMDDSFLTNHASDAGLTATSIEASSDGIYVPIAEGQPVVAKLKADSGIGSNSAHWVLIARLNSDSSIAVYDPTSAVASSHTWSLGSVAAQTDSAFSLSAAAGTTGITSTDDASTTDGGDGYTDDGSYDTGDGM